MVHARHDRLHVVPGVSLEAPAAGVRWLQVLDGGAVAICGIRRPQMDRYEHLPSTVARALVNDVDGMERGRMQKPSKLEFLC